MSRGKSQTITHKENKDLKKKYESKPLLNSEKLLNQTIDVVPEQHKSVGELKDKKVDLTGPLPPLQRGLIRFKTKSVMKASEKSFDMSRVSGTSKGTKVMV